MTRRSRASERNFGESNKPNTVMSTTTPTDLVSHCMLPTLFPNATRATTTMATGKLPIHSLRTTCQSTPAPRLCTCMAAILVMAANQRSVAIAVCGAIPNNNNKIGVISAPPPTPVKPTTNPVKAPAKANGASIMWPHPASQWAMRWPQNLG